MDNLSGITILQNTLRTHFIGHNLSAEVANKELRIYNDVFVMTVYKNAYDQLTYEIKLQSSYFHVQTVMKEMRIVEPIYYFLLGLGKDNIETILEGN